MSPEELYQWALDRAQDALAGAESKLEKLKGHVAATEEWLDEAQAKVAELETKGLEGFLADLGSDEHSGEKTDAPAEVAQVSADGAS